MASLAASNKHLSTAAKRRAAVRLTVATSSAIEGIHAPFKHATSASKAAKPVAAAKAVKVKRVQRAKSV
jgi:hypothetical protein